MQINRQSYEEYFLLYADGELNESEQRAVEEFIDQNPDLAGELNIIQETVFKPDGSIIFENKELLLKNESDNRKVFYMSWFRIAAAAAEWSYHSSPRNAVPSDELEPDLLWRKPGGRSHGRDRFSRSAFHSNGR